MTDMTNEQQNEEHHRKNKERYMKYKEKNMACRKKWAQTPKGKESLRRYYREAYRRRQLKKIVDSAVNSNYQFNE